VPDNDVTGDTGQRQRKARRDTSQDEWWPIGIRTGVDDVTCAAPRHTGSGKGDIAYYTIVIHGYT
jgi:hypothetical protein